MANINNDNVIIFGRTSSKSRIHSSIEFAFETLRKDLSRHMELIAETITKLDYTESMMNDTKLVNKLKKLHRTYRNQVASIPSLWETNEDTLRWLIKPNEVKVTVAITHHPSSHIDFGEWNDVFGALSITNSRQSNIDAHIQHEPPNATNKTASSPSSSSPPSYDALNQVLIHLSRDWGDRGANIRKVLYTDGVIQQLERFLPVSSSIITSQPSSLSSSTASLSSIPLLRQSSLSLTPSRILVPGAGLGRLAVELAVRGYAVEANECSAAMVCSMSTIVNKLLIGNKDDLNISNKTEGYDGCNTNMESNINVSSSTSNNKTLKNRQLTFYPHLYGPLMDLWDMEQRLAPETIPSSDSATLIQRLAKNSGNAAKVKVHSNDNACNNKVSNKSNSNATNDYDYANSTDTTNRRRDFRQYLSIQFSVFVSTYSRSEYHHYFDGIVTCFFIDTAESILDYFLIIQHILKPQGVWVNAGPLHYHRPSAFFYSYTQIKQILTDVLDFELLYESKIETLYAPENGINMKPEMYHIPLFVMRNNGCESDNNNNNNNNSDDNYNDEDNSVMSSDDTDNIILHIDTSTTVDDTDISKRPNFILKR